MLLVSRMAGQENLDRDLRDFQPPKKKVKTTRESGARFKCLTREEMVVLSKGVDSSEIGPFPTKRSNYVQKISTLTFWLFRFVQK